MTVMELIDYLWDYRYDGKKMEVEVAAGFNKPSRPIADFRIEGTTIVLEADDDEQN